MGQSIKIIGIAGTNGAGKDTIGHILAKDHGFLFVSVTDLLRAECRKRNLPIERENLRTISAEWRRESGFGVLVDKAIEQFDQSNKKYAGLALASLRHPSEADRVHELGGRVIWTDADPKIRFERVQSASRGRGGEDNKTYEEFLAEEEAEMHKTGDSATISGADVKIRADIFIENDKDLADLNRELKRIASA